MSISLFTQFHIKLGIQSLQLDYNPNNSNEVLRLSLCVVKLQNFSVPFLIFPNKFLIEEFQAVMNSNCNIQIYNLVESFTSLATVKMMQTISSSTFHFQIKILLPQLKLDLFLQTFKLTKVLMRLKVIILIFQQMLLKKLH